MNAGRTLKLTAHSTIGTHAAHLRAGLTEVLQGILDAAETFNSSLRANSADKNLSERGRAEGMKTVAAAALSKLKAVEETTIKNLTDRAAGLEKTLRSHVSIVPPTDAAERIAHELALQEIRGQLRELTQGERLVVYKTTSDPLVIAAFENAPMVASEKRPDGSRRLEHFLDPLERTAAVLTRGEATDPVTTETLKEVHSLQQAYSLAVNSVRS